MRSRWTHLNIPNPPQGAELAEHHLRPSSDQKNRRKREKVLYTKCLIYDQCCLFVIIIGKVRNAIKTGAEVAEKDQN